MFILFFQKDLFNPSGICIPQWFEKIWNEIMKETPLSYGNLGTGDDIKIILKYFILFYDTNWLWWRILGRRSDYMGIYSSKQMPQLSVWNFSRLNSESFFKSPTFFWLLMRWENSQPRNRKSLSKKRKKKHYKLLVKRRSAWTKHVRVLEQGLVLNVLKAPPHASVGFVR